MGRILTATVVAAVLAAGCADVATVDTESVNAQGALSLSYLAGPGKSLEAQAHVQDTAVFALGDLKASRDFYFIVHNTGGRDVRDVVVSSDNPAFTVSPSRFDVLPPDSVAGISALLRVTAVHGIALDGIGYTALLPMDTNQAHVRIAGVTESNAGVDTSVQTVALVSLNALAMDVRLLSGTTEVTLGQPPQRVSSALGGLGWIDVYNLPNLSLVNTGNVAITLAAYQLPSDLVFKRDTLEVGDTLAGFCTSCVVRLDGNNTITDPSKLQIGNDGAAYIGF